MAKKDGKKVTEVTTESAGTPLAIAERETPQVAQVKKNAGRPKGSKNAPKVSKGIQATVKVNGINELIVTTGSAGFEAVYSTPLGEVVPAVSVNLVGKITLVDAENVVATLRGLPTWNGDLDAFLAHFVGLNASSIALVYNWAHSLTAADLKNDSDK